ncbi:MAG TPA: DMT family transporter [Gaiellaceae bacterium]|nr:DMT family transporter [Gaiellaceae bacterium]
MSRLYLPMLISLAAIWGASFMFIKVADRELEPTTLMFGRTLLAALLLFAFLAARVGARAAGAQLRRAGAGPFLLGVVTAALPFTLIAWGEKHVDSGVAAIANASMPIFVALLALRFRASERSSGLRLVGVFVGLAGVAVLAGVNPRGGWWAVAGTLAVVLASIAYAVGSLWAQHLVEREAALVITTASLIGAALALLPPGLAQLPGSMPGWKVIGSVVALGVAGTAIGQLIYYRMIETDGSARTSLVTYLLPVTALFYGAGLLGEPITIEELVGLVLILAGVALGSGLVRAARRREPAPAPQ